MKHALWYIPILVALGSGCQSDPDGMRGWNAYGDATKVESTDTIPSLGAYPGERTAIVGWVDEVCIVKGCWMTIRDDDGHEVLVRFRDYGFFVPMNSRGRRAVAEGVPYVQTFDVAQRRHLAADAGASEAEMAAITEPETKVVFIADGVWIQGGGLDAPYAPAVKEDCIVDEAAQTDATTDAADAEETVEAEEPTQMDEAS